MPRYDIAHLRIVIVRLVFPHGVIDPYPPSKELHLEGGYRLQTN